MGTYDITLPNTQKIIFPALCVICEKQNPDGRIKLSFLGIKNAPMMTMAIDEALNLNVDSKYYSSNSLNKIDGIPACTGCASGLTWYHRLLKFAYYTAWLPGMVPILLMMPTLISVLFMILCAVSPGVFSLIYPPSFGASFWDGKANFEFKSQKVAEEFLRLNSEAQAKSSDKIQPAAAV